MFSAVSLLVLACAITVNAQQPSSNSQCSPVQTGVQTPHAVKLPTVNLTPFVADWRIFIPQVPECVYGVAGVHAFVCDVDVAPTGSFTDYSNLLVHRNGNLQYTGTVSVTVYCS